MRNKEEKHERKKKQEREAERKVERKKEEKKKEKRKQKGRRAPPPQGLVRSGGPPEQSGRRKDKACSFDLAQGGGGETPSCITLKKAPPLYTLRADHSRSPTPLEGKRFEERNSGVRDETVFSESLETFRSHAVFLSFPAEVFPDATRPQDARHLPFGTGRG